MYAHSLHPPPAAGNKFVLGTVIFSLSLYMADCYPVRNIVVSLHGVPQKGKTFWGEDEGRSECVFAAGGNKRYEATEDEERFAILLVKLLFAKHRFTVQSYFLPEIPFTKFCSEERIMNSE